VAVIAARADVGKSVCLVQIALDELLSGSAVLHISLDSAVSHVRQRYDEVLKRTAMTKPPHEQRLSVEQLRHIHSYRDGTFTAEKLVSSVTFMREHMELTPRLAVIDGIDFEQAQRSRVANLRVAASKLGVEVWLSALIHREDAPYPDDEPPPPLGRFDDAFDVVFRLDPDPLEIGVRRWQRGSKGWSDTGLRLEPSSMLLIPS
jgi:hypothetical protein